MELNFAEEFVLLNDAAKHNPLDIVNRGWFYLGGYQDAIRMLVCKGLLQQVGRVQFELTPLGAEIAANPNTRARAMRHLASLVPVPLYDDN